MPQSPDLAPGQIGLSVTDLDRSIAFYQEVLQLEVIQRSTEAGRRFAFLGSGGRPFLTLWQQSQAAFDPRLAGSTTWPFRCPRWTRCRLPRPSSGPAES